MKSALPPSVRHGFSLVELLVVIMIIAILMGLTVVGTQFALAKSYESKTRIQIKTLEGGLEKFYNDRMEYPKPSTAATAGSKVLYIALTGDGIGFTGTTPTFTGATSGMIDNDNERKWTVYLEELLPASATKNAKSLQGWIDTSNLATIRILDAFGNEIQYVCEVPAKTTQKNAGYDLWSYGTDSSLDKASYTAPSPSAAQKDKINKWIKNW